MAQNSAPTNLDFPQTLKRAFEEAQDALRVIPQTYRTTSTNTPVVSNGVAYTANDQVGDIQTVLTPVRNAASTCVLESVVILDKSAQNAALKIFFFNALPTVASVDNGALNISDAEMAKYIGHVSIAATDYAATSANSGATVKDIQLPLAPAAGTSLFAVMQTTGTPTYTSTSDLVIQYKFKQD